MDGWSSQCAAGSLGTYHLKAVGCTAIPVRGSHAADDLVFFRSDAERFGVDQCVVDMRAKDHSDDQTVVVEAR